MANSLTPVRAALLPPSGLARFSISPLVRAGGWCRRQSAGRSNLRYAVKAAEELVALMAPADGPSLTRWHIQSARWTTSGTAVLTLGPAGERPMAVLKMPRTPAAVADLHRGCRIVVALERNQGLRGWAHLLPHTHLRGEWKGKPYTLTRVAQGVALDTLDPGSGAYGRGIDHAHAAIADLHARTAQEIAIDARIAGDWIDEPLAVLSKLGEGLPGGARYRRLIAGISSRLHEALAGRVATVTWIHGDYCPGNVIVDQEDTEERVSGIIDWGRGAPSALPLHDVMHLMMHAPDRLQAHHDPGAALLAFLANPRLSSTEGQWLEATRPPCELDEAGLQVMALLYWLRHVHTSHIKSPHRTGTIWWAKRNVGDFLDAASQ